MPEESEFITPGDNLNKKFVEEASAERDMLSDAGLRYLWKWHRPVSEHGGMVCGICATGVPCEKRQLIIRIGHLLKKVKLLEESTDRRRKWANLR